MNAVRGHEPQGTWAPGPDGLRAAGLIAAIGLALFLWRIGDPAKLVFDESFYVPAGQFLFGLVRATNIEHPPLGKWLIGLSIRLFGDTPFGWRAMSALFGAITLFGLVMATSWTMRSVRAGAMAGALALLGQLLFVMARVAMLDIFLVGFLMLALWMVAAALQAERGNRWRLALAGLFFGLAGGCKWTAILLAILLALALFGWSMVRAIRQKRSPWDWLTDRTLSPFRGLSTIEAAGWLGPFAALAYLATFTPMLFCAEQPLALSGLIGFQFEILAIQRQPMAPHPYSSVPWQWLLDLRPIWFFYEPVEGVYRGVLLLGNPVVMWAGLAAIPAALWAGLRSKAPGVAIAATGFLVSLGMWLIIPKPVMFYHYYLLPSLFLCAALAGVIDRLWAWRAARLGALALFAAAILVFRDFYPILSGAPLSGPGAFQHWMWFQSWR
jgi:dolichyl-phosphate-mannose-protein mannosyltransferase